MISAIERADVVGLYDSSHPNILCRVYQEHIAGLKFDNSSEFCTPAVHFYLQQSGHLSEVINAAESITLITGRDIRSQFSDRFPGKKVIQLLLPSESAFRLENENPRDEHYPLVFEAIKSEIESISRHLVLVGGGFLCKIYCDIAKRKGAIAIDVGSVFDYWAGIPTREGYMTIKSGKIELQRPPFRPAMSLYDEPIGERAAHSSEAMFKSWEISESPHGTTTRSDMPSLRESAKLAGAPFEQGQPLDNYLPDGALYLWASVPTFKEFAFVGTGHRASEIVAKARALIKHVEGNDRSLAIAITENKPQWSPDMEKELNTLMSSSPSSIFFCDLRVYEQIKDRFQFDHYDLVDLKLATGTQFGTHAGFLIRH